MTMIKISSKVEEDVWVDFKTLANDSHQQISGLMTEALQEYLQRKKVRPAVLEHLEASMSENNELGKLLAK
jgi:predicted transcriptional regulator